MYEALKAAFGEYNESDILAMIKEKRLHHLCIADTDIWVSLYQYPRKNVLFIHLLEGTDIKHKIHEITRVLTEMAKAWNCSEIRCEGRAGWEPLLKDIGAKKIYTVMSLEVV